MNAKNRPLVIGIVLSIVTTAGFIALMMQLSPDDSGMWQFDREVAQKMIEFSKDEVNVGYGMIGLTMIGGVPAMVLLSLAGLSWSLWKRQYLLAVAWVAIPGVGAVLNVTLKKTINRERPPVDMRDPFVDETNQSFPSGHAMGSTIGIGVLGYTFWLQLERKRRRWFIAAALALVVFGVGMSRVYLRAHWFSDVMAGFLIGTTCLSLGIGYFETRREKTGEEMPQETSTQASG